MLEKRDKKDYNEIERLKKELSEINENVKKTHELLLSNPYDLKTKCALAFWFLCKFEVNVRLVLEEDRMYGDYLFLFDDPKIIEIGQNYVRYLEDSLRIVNECLRKDPEYISALEIKSKIFAYMNNFKGAVKICEDIVEINPYNEFVKLYLKDLRDLAGLRSLKERYLNNSPTGNKVYEPSKTEELLFDSLNDLGLYPERQYKISYMTVDFAFPKQKLVVEVDGHYHRQTEEQQSKDHKRNNMLISLGWYVLHYSAESVHANPEKVAYAIQKEIQNRKKKD